MLNNRKFLKVSAYIGLLSIVSSNVAVAIPPKAGELYIHARKELRIVGAPPLLPVVEDISKVSHEDFDVTENCPPLMKQFGDFVWKSEKRKIRKWHLDTNIPYIGGNNPKVDYMALRGIPMFLALSLGRKLHPREQAGAQDFFEEIIKNQQKLGGDTQEIPDMDCLYYKDVNGEQHLFLRLSSETRKRAEIFNKESNGKTIYIEKGNAKLISDGNATLDHAKIKADNIEVDVKDTLLNRASKMKAKWVIRLKAGKQKNETVINKWVREDRGKHHFTHTEGVESVDDCVFVAEEVIQEGDEVENIGIYVEADKYEDRATHTSNMPAKITLYNYAWEEDDGMFSHAETSVKRKDDVLVPTRYHVNYYKSDSSKPGSSVKYGYTLINAGSRIEVLKDIKEDVVVDEEHTIEIHEEKSGFSFCGGVSVPDPTKLLRKIDKASSSGNMLGLTTSMISAVAKGIRAVNDYETVSKLMSQQAPLGKAGAVELLKVLSHYVNGPSIQFGSRSFDMRQKQTQTHGNTMFAPYMKFHNKKSSSFAGTYKGKEIDIKTGTFVTFDLPQTMESEMEMHQSGISMDLLTFAVMLMAPEIAGAMEAAMAASSINVSFEENKSRVVQHKPTVIQADKINIEADNGYLTQAQIKAGIVHAVFTNDLVLKTLANEKWETREGGGMSFGLGALVGFETLAETLVEAAASSSISSIDSGSFEKVIDDFASMVGEEEFYLKVGNILRTESAFVGHKTHDPKKEHIEAKERQDVKVEESRDSWDNSFDLVIGDWMTVANTFGKQVFDNAIEEGATTEEAQKIADQEAEQLKENIAKEQPKIEETAEKVAEIDEKVKAKSKGSNKEKTEAIVDGLKSLAKERAKLDVQKIENEVQAASLKTRKEIIDEAMQRDLHELDKLEAAEKIRRADEAVLEEKNWITTWGNPWLADQINEESTRRRAEDRVAREYKLKRDLVNKWYKTELDFLEGKGFETKPKLEQVWIDHETSMDYLVSTDELNRDENRWHRLHQKNLSEIGESDEQRAIKELPVFGMFTKPYMDYKYGKISGADAVGEVVGDIAKEGATTVAGGAILKGAGKLAKPVLKTGAAKVSELLSKSKSARMARFGENLSAGYSSKKVATASTSGTSMSKNVVALDWESVKFGENQLPVFKHIELEHAKFNPAKLKNGVFYGNPKVKIDQAWQKIQKLGIKPIDVPGRKGKLYDHYVVPFEHAGYEYSGGLAKDLHSGVVFPNTNCDYITIVVEKGTNRLKNAYPSSRTANQKAKDYFK